MNATFESPAPATQPKAGKPAKRTILLADDDPAIRQILRRLLERENYRVLTAANGAEAVELAAAKVDLALLDLSMPVKDGWETFKQLSTENPSLPIILMTARPNQFFPALASGVRALLEKPLDLEKLLPTIKNLLEETVETRRARFTKGGSAFSHVPPPAPA
jgi:CheY-like chemotaxis protein